MECTETTPEDLVFDSTVLIDLDKFRGDLSSYGRRISVNPGNSNEHATYGGMVRFLRDGAMYLWLRGQWLTEPRDRMSLDTCAKSILSDACELSIEAFDNCPLEDSVRFLRSWWRSNPDISFSQEQVRRSVFAQLGRMTDFTSEFETALHIPIPDDRKDKTIRTLCGQISEVGGHLRLAESLYSNQRGLSLRPLLIEDFESIRQEISSTTRLSTIQ